MKKTILSLLVILLTATAISAAPKEIYVSPSGDDSASGTIEAPFLTIKKAIETAIAAGAGSTIYLREGTYRPTTDQIMRREAEGVYDCVYNLSKDGTADKPFTITGYEDEKAIVDLSLVKPDARVIGFYVKNSYWHLKKFDIIGIQVTQTGHTQSINVGLFGGSNCVIEQVNMHDGMGIGVYATRGSNNLVLNCDAYNNYDSVSENGAGGNCDGFGFHLNNNTHLGNVVRGCRAWRNSDDGFDLISNQSPVTFEECWAWENGYDANLVSRGDGMGFKSGGYGMGSVKEGTVVPRNTVRNCIAWANKQNGFYANHHLGGLDFCNNSAYANKRNYNMVCRKPLAESADAAKGEDVPGYGHNLKNNLSYAPKESGSHLVNFDTELSKGENNTFYPTTMSVSASDFISLDASQLKRPRKADGSLPDITFLSLQPTSALYKAGIGHGFSAQSGIGELLPDEAADNREEGIDNGWWDLRGNRVTNPRGGIFIHNGAKIYVP